jgi:hypothetical protein
MRAATPIRSFRLPLLAGLLSSAAPVLAGPAPQDCIVEWEAASGLLPDEAAHAWTLVDSSAVGPVLSAGKLALCSTEYAGIPRPSAASSVAQIVVVVRPCQWTRGAHASGPSYPVALARLP